MDWRLIVAQHAAERAAARLRRRLARGLSGLATVAATALFVGIEGALWGIVNSFKSPGCHSTGLGAVAGGISESMELLALGLAVAIIASTGYQYLSAQLAELDVEMQVAAQALPDRLMGSSINSTVGEKHGTLS
jgi:biopolymer transport protein ExbB/TolQ